MTAKQSLSRFLGDSGRFLGVPMLSSFGLLLESRLFAQSASQIGVGTGAPRHLDHEALYYVLNEVQQVLRMELIRILQLATEDAVPLAPIKGADALLWGPGQFARMYTRDLDILLLQETNRPKLEALLGRSGYIQLHSIDRATGEVKPAVPSEMVQFESNQIEYWPWTKFVPLPHLLPYRNLIARFESQLDPLILVRGVPHVMCNVDAHHAVWPGVPAFALRYVVDCFGGTTTSRLAPADNIATAGGKAVTQLRKGDIAASGSLFQVSWLMRRLPGLAAGAIARAGELGITESVVEFVKISRAIQSFSEGGGAGDLDRCCEALPPLQSMVDVDELPAGEASCHS